MICLGEKFSSPSPNSCEHSLMLLLSSDSLLFHGAHERSEDSLNRARLPNFNYQLYSIQFPNHLYCHVCS